MIEVIDLGVISFREAWEQQDGRQNCAADWVSSPETIRADHIDIIPTNRGGRITYHGPGQIVGYLICDIQSYSLGVRGFVRAIEEILILTAADYGISAHRDDNNPGVTSLEKILGQVPPRQTVIAKLLQHTGEILHTRLKYASSGRGNIPRREPNPPRELSDEYKRP